MKRAATSARRSFATSATPAEYSYSTIIPTYYYQKGLHKLPIPTLQETIKKFLYFAEPVLTNEQFELTKKAALEFEANAGLKLHTTLTEWDKNHSDTSYIAEMWYDMYLENRDPLPLNLNPQLSWRDDTRSPVGQGMNERCTRAANLIYAAASFHCALEDNKLKPDVFIMKPEVYNNPIFQNVVKLLPPKYGYLAAAGLAQSYPLDMSQYPRLFKSTRVPKEKKDELWTSSKRIKHIVVQRGPRFYTLQVLTDDYKPISPVQIEANLRAILAEGEKDSITGSKGDASLDGTTNRQVGVTNINKQSYEKEAPIGALTGLERNEWAKARDVLNKVCPAEIEAIDSALFVLTLDDSSPEDPASLSRAMLHGDARNRWFDKCFNLIVNANGRAGVAWEHAWGDGAAVLYFFNEVFKHVNSLPMREPVTSNIPNISGSSGNLAKRLDFSNALKDPFIISSIRKAESYTDGVISDTNLQVYQMPSFTKEDIKKSNLSPDGVMQMSMQIAHWRAHGYTPSTYESASTAAYKHGRTETIRVATPESVELCRIFSDNNTSKEGLLARYAMLSKAANRHRKTTLECVTGKGVDRHLFAMEKWASRTMDSVPGIFTDKGFQHFKTIRLSTSTLSSDALEGGGFGPVNRSSYGVGYGVEERGTHFHIMSYKGPTTNNNDYAACCDSSLKDFQACIQAAKEAGVLAKEGK